MDVHTRLVAAEKNAEAALRINQKLQATVSQMEQRLGKVEARLAQSEMTLARHEQAALVARASAMERGEIAG